MRPSEIFPNLLMSEDFLDEFIMETGDTVKNTIRGCASFGHQDMDMGMEVDAITESLDHRHPYRHKPKACHCVQESHKRAHRRETEIVEHRFYRRRLRSLEHHCRCLADIFTEPLNRRDHIYREVHMVIVFAVERDPGRRDKTLVYPVAQKCRLAKASRSRDQGQLAVFYFTEFFQKTGAGDHVRPETRNIEFSGDKRIPVFASAGQSLRTLSFLGRPVLLYHEMNWTQFKSSSMDSLFLSEIHITYTLADIPGQKGREV
jgi:hypothetical protein